MTPRLTVVPDAAAVHAAFARAIADEIAAGEAESRLTRLILPVGPIAHYPLLTRICNEERISWNHVRFTTMDEYLDWTGRPLPEDHPLSFTGFMRRFLASLDEPLRPPYGAFVHADPFDIDRVARFIEEIGGIDTCYGGIGVHGHVAFNEPPLSRFTTVSVDEFLASPTRVVPLAPETIVMNATRSAGGRFADFPPMAVTIGMREILGARRIRLFCDGGTWQQEALDRAVHGPADLAYPVSLLARHPDVEIVADAVTATKPGL
jgi:glucosamine-6-phosphate deaminase